MKSLLKLILCLVLLAGLGFGAYVLFLRPQPVVWKTTLGILPVPHCPYCDSRLLAVDDACPTCKRTVLWEGKEQLKQDLKNAADKIEQGAKEAGKDIENAAEDLKKKAQEDG